MCQLCNEEKEVHRIGKNKEVNCCVSCHENLKRERKSVCDRLYREKNKEKIDQMNKEWSKTHREHINLKATERRKRDVELGVKTWADRNKDKVKEADKRSYQKCKEKRLKQSLDWSHKNKEGRKEIVKRHYEKNREKILEGQKIHRQLHPEYYANYSREKEKVDDHFRITRRLRNRVYQTLKGYRKVDKTLNLLGCSIEELKAHLEAQFTEGMSWDNYGKWHIDHIKPCAMFDLIKEEEQKICFHYTNMQPLWASENCSKGNRYEGKRSKDKD